MLSEKRTGPQLNAALWARVSKSVSDMKLALRMLSSCGKLRRDTSLSCL